MRVSSKYVTKKLLPLREARAQRKRDKAEERRCRVMEQLYNQDVAETEAACATLRRCTPEYLAEKYKAYS